LQKARHVVETLNALQHTMRLDSGFSGGVDTGPGKEEAFDAVATFEAAREG
jgi:hypothetical protein